MSKVLNILSSLEVFLQGKKTYIVAALMIALGLLQNDHKMVLDGVGFMTLRNAIPAPQPTTLP